MNLKAIRKAVQDTKYQTWSCYKCESLVPDAEMFFVGNGDTGEAIVLHRRCVADLLKPRVSREQAKRTQRRRASR